MADDQESVDMIARKVLAMSHKARAIAVVIIHDDGTPVTMYGWRGQFIGALLDGLTILAQDLHTTISKQLGKFP